MSGYLNAGVNDGIILHNASGASQTIVITQGGTHVFAQPSGTVAGVMVASGVFGANTTPALKIVDTHGTFAQMAITISGATGSNITFNGASTLSLATAYKVYTGVIFSGTAIGGNLITQ